ncbi:hypothetical protein BC834DRAFT_530483 [Gloeopeniophorella convolvens]|nr:hypothetical protein BC834DRAFT_530483 [Gloeopeniophorella convolvens]
MTQCSLHLSHVKFAHMRRVQFQLSVAAEKIWGTCLRGFDLPSSMQELASQADTFPVSIGSRSVGRTLPSIQCGFASGMHAAKLCELISSAGGFRSIARLLLSG